LVVEPTPLKNMLVKLDHFPNFWGENNKYLSCHLGLGKKSPFPSLPVATSRFFGVEFRRVSFVSHGGK